MPRRDVSRDPEFKWPVLLADGGVISAIELARVMGVAFTVRQVIDT